MRHWNISANAIRGPIAPIMLFVILLALGTVTFSMLPIERFPNIDIPIVTTTITQAGASPAELETQVTRKVEDQISSITGVKHITSTITDGVSLTTVQFKLEVDVDRALNDVKDAVSKVRLDLPRSIDEPISQRLDISGLPIMTYTVNDPAKTLEELSWFVDDVVARQLQTVAGVAKIGRIGGVTREIRVSLDPDRLLALGITAGEVNAQLRVINTDLAGGRAEIGGTEQSIRTLAGASSVATLAATAITLPGGRKVRLDEIANVTDSAREPREFARVNGRAVVAFNVQRAAGSSDTTVAQSVAAKIGELRAQYPSVEMTEADSSVTYTVGNYNSTMTTLIEGAILAIVVVFIFLRDWRATMIAAIALPLSVLPTFFFMQVSGFSLNLVTLLALTLVTGVLVDDAIVEIENIVRHMRQGKSPYRAAIEAADEIGLAVIAITATIIAIFVPVSFMTGIAGIYFRQFGLTVAAAVFFSLLVARLITPLLAAYFLRETGHADKEGWLLRRYTSLIRWSVQHKLATVTLGLLIFAASIFSMQTLPSGFIPKEDASRIVMAAEMPPGARLADMEAMTDRMTEVIRRRKEVISVFVDGGKIQGFFGGGDEVRKATLVINLVHKDDRTQSQRDIEQGIVADLADIPDLRSWVMNENGERALNLIVSGNVGDGVAVGAAQLVSEIRRSVPLLANVQTSSALDRPELRFRPRADIAAELGVTTDALSEVVRIATIGDADANLAKFRDGDRQIPIRVQINESARADPLLIEALKVRTGSGATVPLSTIASIERGQGPSSIDRYDRERRVNIGADLVGTDALGEALEAVKALPAAKSLPPGVVLKESGDAEVMGEVFSSFALALGAGLLMVYAVLVLLLGSFLTPITILFSLPLSIGGVIFALMLTGRPISMPVVIGILMLMGIVTKNAIMLVEFAVEEIKAGVPRLDALVDAGRKRARPIVMTTIAMAGGMLPSALALGDGGEFRSPMAIAVIGGLAFSTVLSLVFVPAVFILMDDIGSGLARIGGRFVGPTDEPGAQPVAAE